MNDLITQLIAMLPIKPIWIAVITLALPQVTKIVYGAVKQQGLRGIWRSVWFGSAHIDTPTQPDNMPGNGVKTQSTVKP